MLEHLSIRESAGGQITILIDRRQLPFEDRPGSFLDKCARSIHLMIPGALLRAILTVAGDFDPGQYGDVPSTFLDIDANTTDRYRAVDDMFFLSMPDGEHFSYPRPSHYFLELLGELGLQYAFADDGSTRSDCGCLVRSISSGSLDWVGGRLRTGVEDFLTALLGSNRGKMVVVARPLLCKHCAGFGSSLKEDDAICTHCDGTGLPAAIGGA